MRLLWFTAQKKRRIRAIEYVLTALFLSIPFPLLTSMPAGAAGLFGGIIINELSTSGQNDWVELYNTTSQPINVNGWYIKNQANVTSVALSGEIATHGFLVVEAGNFFNDSGDAIHLFDETDIEITSVIYSIEGPIQVPEPGQSTARTVDAGLVWATGTPTKAVSNTVPDLLPPPVPGSGTPNESLESARAMFHWQAVADNRGGAVQYELRASQDSTQVGAVSDEGSTAWPSGLLASNSMPASAINALTDSVWYWQVRAVDEAGNRSAWSSVWNVEFDRTVPNLTTSQPASGALYGGPLSMIVPVEGVALDIHAPVITAILDGHPVSAQLSTEAVEGGVKIVGGLDTKNISNGAHSLVFHAVDSVGNVSEVALGFTVDKDAPVLVTSFENEQTLKGTVEIDLQATDPHLATSAIAIFNSRGGLVQTGEVKSDEGEAIEDEAGRRTYTWNTTSVEDGAYTIRFTARDAAGNEAALTRTAVVKNDIGGLGGGVSLTEDPLLQQLSQNLTQPFITPQPFVIPQQGVLAAALQQTDNNEITPEMEDVANTDMATLPVAATGEGWRILGLLWYWWLLLGLLGGLVVYRLWQIIRQRQLNVIE